MGGAFGNMISSSFVFVFWILFFFNREVTSEQSLAELMKEDGDISQFYSLLEVCNICNFTLENEPLTVFAPINAAFQKITGQIPNADSMVLYHITNIPKKIEQLGVSYTSMATRLSGGPPLWVTLSRSKYHDNVYINNARLLTSQSNIIGVKNVGRGGPFNQVLHKIDDVLFPTSSSGSSVNTIFNPNAWEFMDNYDSSLIQGTHRVRNFRQKVQQFNKQDIFRTEGGHTFFIPVDEGFGNNRANLLDEIIIDGHVIPRQVLFTTPTKKDVPFQTLANRDNVIRVVISFTQEQRESTIINYVKSHTLFGDGKHPQGVILAEIVKANIPVKNGVIHLIHKPLMIVDSTIKELLQDHMDYICNVGNVQRMENIWNETPKISSRFLPHARHAYDTRIPLNDDKDGGILNNFLNEINDLGPEGQSFLRTIERSQEVTLFAPCNSAFDGQIVNSLKRDKQKFMEILQMHVVVDNRLYLDTIRKENEHKIYQVPTLVKGRNLYFNVLNVGNNMTMTVEGGGVNATVIQPDLAAKNGVIHIIDRVLGLPYSTILEKVSTDPMLAESFKLGRQQQFNAQLNQTNKKFTYFVPRNKAWENARVMMPSTIKKLFMQDFAYHAVATLQRHLISSDDVYTMERIKKMTRDVAINQSDHTNLYQPPAVELPSLRGSLKIFVEEKMDNKSTANSTENTTYIIHWEGLRIPVFRPNVECTNGIIHVIDVPFLKKSDIQVAKGGIFKPSVAVSLICFLFVMLAFE